jgi:hypothetical protein
VGAPAIATLRGFDPEGVPLEVTVGDEWTVFFFVTSSCYGCRAIWDGFGTRFGARPAGSDRAAAGRGTAGVGGGPPAGARSWSSAATGKTPAILVTPSPSTESAKQVAALAPAGIEVLMSSEAWHAYGVTAAPWYVVVAGGVVVAEGPAPASWRKVKALLESGS